MANTINQGDGIIEITQIDSDWDFVDNFSQSAQLGIQVEWIAFTPGSSDDKCSLKHATATGPHIFPFAVLPIVGVAQVVYYRGARLKPYLDYSDGTFTDGCQLIIKLS